MGARRVLASSCWPVFGNRATRRRSMTRKSPIFLLPMKYFTFQWRFAWAMSGGSQRSLLRRERGSTRPYVGRNNTDGFDPVVGGRTRPAFDGARVRPRSCCDYGGVVRNHHGNLSGTHLGCFGFLGQCKPDPPSPWVVLVPPVSGTVTATATCVARGQNPERVAPTFAAHDPASR